jgi:hypothetical protein
MARLFPAGFPGPDASGLATRSTPPANGIGCAARNVVQGTSAVVLLRAKSLDWF